MSASIQPQSTSRAEALIHRITVDVPASIPHDQLIADLPEILFAALELLLASLITPGHGRPNDNAKARQTALGRTSDLSTRAQCAVWRRLEQLVRPFLITMNDRLPEIYKPGALRVVTPCADSDIGIGIDMKSGETIRIRIPVSDALTIGQVALSHSSGSSGIPNCDVSKSLPVD